ncbi:DUF305 domain-containing protein [Calothrix sp. 336/3]|uniref:DUF305 domain-containing protein n=1 Tax=Calothrix sp. 336/3 TaxID=1337936 RepID=UPI0004E2FCAD|nr:DUF305 domain-containing protein [Calothrix sp. 336/3]AKG24583.1 hypothetical protein IJ00_11210 [Calothrix sp. 336/3]
MSAIQFKNTFLAATLAIASLTATSLLTSCTTGNDKQAQASNSTEVSNKQVSNKQHGNMHHNTNMNHHNMDLGPGDASYDLRFIDGMIPHHEGAVVMAKDALKKSKRPEIKKLANAIIKAQDKEISELKTWRKAWYPQAPKAAQAWNQGMKHMMAMSSEHMKMMRMDMDLGNSDAEFDLRFINAMIPHHEGAVVMAKDALNKSKRPQIQKLANAIISSQEAEIKQMQQWRKNWYGK